MRNPFGSGWFLPDHDLDDETGELLWTVLHAQMATDPDNPADTAAAQGRHEEPVEKLHDGTGPRSLKQRRHDALKLGLRALLDSRALGARDKAVPHIAVTVGLDALHDLPGALPAIGASGQRLPIGLVRRWLCDSALTRFVLSLGHRVVEKQPHRSHAEAARTQNHAHSGRPGVPGLRLPTSTRQDLGTAPRHAVVALPHHLPRRHRDAVRALPPRPPSRRRPPPTPRRPTDLRPGPRG